MILKIKNFGPINNFNFDLSKDFHLIVGKNNIGKSYAITVAYLLIKTMMTSREEVRFARWMLPSDSDVLSDLSSKSKTLSDNKEVDISDEYKSFLNKLLKEQFLVYFQEAIVGTFNDIDLVKSQYNDGDLSIELEHEGFSFSIGLKDRELFIRESDNYPKVKLRSISQRRKPKKTKDEIIIYYSTNDKSYYRESFVNTLLNDYMNIVNIISQEVKSIHYLPASRSGLYQALGAFSQIIAELSKSRSFVRKKIELPAISEPLSDYFLSLSEITVRRQSYIDSPTNKIAEKIEKNILKGSVEFDSKTKKILYTPHGTELRLDLSSTSSMVSELSPIVSYLRYILTKPSARRRTKSSNSKSKPLIFIEEPEAHLHPDVQVKLMEYFIELVKNDVKLIMTSHSNYLFNKTNNLIMKGDLSPDTLQATMLKNTDSGSVAESLDFDDLGIEDENFVSTSEYLYEEKITLINEINNND